MYYYKYYNEELECKYVQMYMHFLSKANDILPGITFCFQILIE